MTSLNTILVNTQEGKKLIHPDEIICIRARRKKSEITLTTNHKIIANCCLIWFEKNLPGNTFLRSHRSYIINILYVKAFTAYSLIFDHQTSVPMGRQFSDKIKKCLSG